MILGKYGLEERCSDLMLSVRYGGQSVYMMRQSSTNRAVDIIESVVFS
jgi:hypothetical protein